MCDKIRKTGVLESVSSFQTTVLTRTRGYDDVNHLFKMCAAFCLINQKWCACSSFLESAT